MGMFNLKGGSNSWNYHTESKPGYMTSLTGTVVEVSNPQARDFNTGQPKFWPDGNPVRNLRLAIRGESGRELTWTFSPKSVAADACLKALDPDGTRPEVSLEELLGKNITVGTKPGTYNNRNPRPWMVVVNGPGDASAVRGLVDMSQQQQPQPTQQQAAEAFNAPAQPSAPQVYEDIPF